VENPKRYIGFRSVKEDKYKEGEEDKYKEGEEDKYNKNV
jgi:hypothetical protein